MPTVGLLPQMHTEIQGNASLLEFGRGTVWSGQRFPWFSSAKAIFRWCGFRFHFLFHFCYITEQQSCRQSHSHLKSTFVLTLAKTTLHSSEKKVMHLSRWAGILTRPTAIPKEEALIAAWSFEIVGMFLRLCDKCKVITTTSRCCNLSPARM